MKVVAINGSPRKGGNCAQMLDVLGRVLENEGIEFEVCQPGAKVHPCMACYHCLDNGTLRCVQDDDGVNEIIEKCIEADGIVLASPVYHGGIAGGMKCVLDRLILAAGCGENLVFSDRSCAPVLSCTCKIVCATNATVCINYNCFAQ